MQRKFILIVVALLFLLPAHSFAHNPGDAEHQLYSLGDFKLVNGEVIKDFSISYVTHGTLNQNKDNVILMASSLAGNHHRIDYLIGKGKAYDPDKYFIICTDAIGNGLTTSPSNSKSQPGMTFPSYSIQDMVNSQHRLVTEKFGITKLLVVTGASMGGMQSLQWGASYPDMVRNIVAIIPLGKGGPWMKFQCEAMRRAIMLDPAWNNGNYTSQPEKGMKLWATLLFGLSVNTPQAINENFNGDTQKALEWLAQNDERLWKAIDANDFITQSKACDSFDLGQTPGFDGDYLKVLASIKARTLILSGSGDLLCPEDEAKFVAYHMPNATFKLIAPPRQRGHLSGAGATVPEVNSQNEETAKFLEKAQ
ncbi:MAG: alpha/beta fold hydrolase [Desulfovibrio sp.]|jgi:homoserine O-acetyltransferase|nr:alpha/beta fold hydrolase [Desulfovibrio sp.]